MFIHGGFFRSRLFAQVSRTLLLSIVLCTPLSAPQKVFAATDEPPVITILGDNPLRIYQGEAFADPGATAMDLEDGDLTADISVSTNLDTATPGIYDYNYDVADLFGNYVLVTRQVEVLEEARVVSVSASTSDGAFRLGQTIPVTVTFSRPVRVVPYNFSICDQWGNCSSDFRSPRLNMQVTDGSTRLIDYVSGSETDTLVFDYVVQAGDASLDLEYAAADALLHNDRDNAMVTITDLNGHEADLALPALGSAQSLAGQKDLIIDHALRSAVTSVSSEQADGAYKAGETVTLAVNFDGPVFVTPYDFVHCDMYGHCMVLNSYYPVLNLLLGESAQRPAAYLDGSGSATLRFTYEVQPGDETADLDYFASSSLLFNANDNSQPTIKDQFGNAVLTALPEPGAENSLGYLKELIIDGIAPAAELSDLPANPTTEPTAAIRVGGADVVDYRYRLDGSDWSDNQGLEAGIVLEGLANGSHAIEVVGLDTAGNWQSTSTPTTYAWQIESEPPVSTVSAFVDGGNGTSSYQFGTWTNQDVTISFSCADSASGCELTPAANHAPYHCIDQDDTCTPDLAASEAQITANGTWFVRYFSRDAAGFAEVVRSVVVNIDNAAPVIALNGLATVNLNAGDTYADAGATASDSRDGDLTAQLSVSNNVNTAQAGTYFVVYNVADSVGNAAAQKVRTVTVAAPEGGEGGGGGAIVNPEAPIAPAGGFVLRINGGFPTTYARAVTLTLDGGEQAVNMAIANSLDFTSANIEPYAQNKLWTLTAGFGDKLVCAKFYSAAGVASEAVCAAVNYASEGVLGVKQYANGTLIRMKGDKKIYVLVNGKKRHIRTLKELRKYKGKRIYAVDQATLNHY